ncbi:hypothetical protein, partial [Arthrobacter pascens]|uniref:hypothetical protein n=1 Tax=Arthrobacter pascens TaxID=1677 RepID=UPI00196A6787
VSTVLLLQLWCCYFVVVFVPWATYRVTGLLVGNHIVDASSLVSFYHPLVRTPFEVGFAGWCVV